MGHILITIKERIKNMIHNQQGATDEVLITVVGIGIAAILMFIFPLMSVSERNDDIAQGVVQTATSEFVENIATVGSIRASDYEAYLQKLNATGNNFDVAIEVQHLDENLYKKSNLTSQDLIGQNVYYTTFTSEILSSIYSEDGEVKDYKLKKGDYVIVTAKNTNKTIAQTLRAFFYKVTGQGISQIAVSCPAMVVNNGK